MSYNQDSIVEFQYTYNDKDYLVEKISYKLEDGKVNWRETYEYDDDGNKIEEIRFDTFDHVKWKWYYKYDNKGNITKQINYRIRHGKSQIEPRTIEQKNFEYYD